jgi:hypothetical protein
MIYKVGIEPGDEGTEVFVSVDFGEEGEEISTIEVIQKPGDIDFQPVMEGVLGKLVADTILKNFLESGEE